VNRSYIADNTCVWSTRPPALASVAGSVSTSLHSTTSSRCPAQVRIPGRECTTVKRKRTRDHVVGAARPASTLPHCAARFKLFSAQARMHIFFAFISKTTCFLFPATKCANVHSPKNDCPGCRRDRDVAGSQGATAGLPSSAVPHLRAVPLCAGLPTPHFGQPAR
jgi:hypothetical protein